MTAALDYDPFSTVLQADPYRTYAEMRARGGLCITTRT
jgi:hypothetical protein